MTDPIEEILTQLTPRGAPSELREQALAWGATTKFSSGEVAQAMAELGKMGNKTNDILALMPGTMALAAAGEISMGEAANFSMGILNQFGLGLDKATNVADILATGASGAATSVAGLASAMNNTGLMANMAGLSIEDTTQALMAMASKNIEGAEAGTLFKNAMKALSVMTGKTRGGFEKMGIDVDNFRDSTTGQITDFWGLIEAMKATGEVGQGIMTETFDIRALQALSAIVGTSTEQMAEYASVLDSSEGASKKMSETLMKGLEPMIQFQSIMQNLKVIMGEFIAEALTPALKKFNLWMGNMQENHTTTLKVIASIMMFLTALGAILIPLGLLISSIGTIIGLVKTIIGLTKLWSAIQVAFNAIMSANPIALVIIGIAALIAITIIVIKYWDEITAALKRAWIKMVEVYDAVKGLAMIFGGPLVVPLLFIIETIRSLVNSWQDIKEAFTDRGFLAGIAELGKAILGGLVEPFKAVLDLIIAVKDKIGGAFGAVQDFFSGQVDSAANPYARRGAEAPSPGRGSGRGADATASVSVYTKGDLGVAPFTESGDLGYNMESSSTRGRI